MPARHCFRFSGVAPRLCARHRVKNPPPALSPPALASASPLPFSARLPAAAAQPPPVALPHSAAPATAALQQQNCLGKDVGRPDGVSCGPRARPCSGPDHSTGQKTPLPWSIMKLWVLNLPWPKGAPTVPVLEARQQYDFAEERTRCLELVKTFTRKDWRKSGHSIQFSAKSPASLQADSRPNIWTITSGSSGYEILGMRKETASTLLAPGSLCSTP